MQRSTGPFGQGCRSGHLLWRTLYAVRNPQWAERRKSIVVVAVLGVQQEDHRLDWPLPGPQVPLVGDLLYGGFFPCPFKGTPSLPPLAEETLARTQAGL